MPRLGTTGRAATTYLVLAGLQRGVSLMILPFISHSMPPDEFGAASMLTATSWLLIAVIAAPLIPLVVRAAARGDDDGPALIRIAGMYTYLVLPIVGALVAVAVTFFVPEFLGVAGFIWGIELLAIALVPATSTFALSVAQAREDLPKFVWISATSVLTTAAAKLVLVVVMEMGVRGWAISDLISAFLSAILAMWLVRVPRTSLSVNHVRSTLSFTLPLIPHLASLWAITALSRPAMAAVSSLEQVGLLAFGLSLAMVANLVLAEINRAVLTRYSRETFPAPTGETLGVVGWQLVAALVVPAVVGTGVAVAGRWIFAEAYWPSFGLTGVLLIGQAAYGIYLIPMNYLTQTAGRPKYSALASGAGAALIFVSILLLGHRYGAIGAACATAAGYVAQAVVALVLAKALRLDVAWRTWRANSPELALGAGALASCLIALAAPVGSSLMWTSSGTCMVLAVSAVVVASRQRHDLSHRTESRC